METRQAAVTGLELRENPHPAAAAEHLRLASLERGCLGVWFWRPEITRWSGGTGPVPSRASWQKDKQTEESNGAGLPAELSLPTEHCPSVHGGLPATRRPPWSHRPVLLLEASLPCAGTWQVGCGAQGQRKTARGQQRLGSCHAVFPPHPLALPPRAVCYAEPRVKARGTETGLASRLVVTTKSPSAGDSRSPQELPEGERGSGVHCVLWVLAYANPASVLKEGVQQEGARQGRGGDTVAIWAWASW